MKVQRVLVALGLMAVLLITATTTQASAQAATNTSLTVAGTLSISAPASISLGTAGAGQTTSGTLLGTVTVSDTRGASTGWIASVTGSAMTAVTSIPTTSIFYWSGPTTATTSIVTSTPGQATAANKQDLSASRTAFTATAVGANSLSFNPTVVVTVPATAPDGTYTGTITHSVA